MQRERHRRHAPSIVATSGMERRRPEALLASGRLARSSRRSRAAFLARALGQTRGSPGARRRPREASQPGLTMAVRRFTSLQGQELPSYDGLSASCRPSCGHPSCDVRPSLRASRPSSCLSFLLPCDPPLRRARSIVLPSVGHGFVTAHILPSSVTCQHNMLLRCETVRACAQNQRRSFCGRALCRRALAPVLVVEITHRIYASNPQVSH